MKKTKVLIIAGGIENDILPNDDILENLEIRVILKPFYHNTIYKEVEKIINTPSSWKQGNNFDQ